MSGYSAHLSFWIEYYKINSIFELSRAENGLFLIKRLKGFLNSFLIPPPPHPHGGLLYRPFLHLVALWFILRGDLLYVFPCVILFLCFSVLLVLRLPRLGKRELILVLFVRLFGLCLFRFVGFLFLLASRKGCGLWLWHSLDFSLTFFCKQRN